MIVSIITLIVLLIGILFIKSTIILAYDGTTRKTKINLFGCILDSILAFVPFLKWGVLIGVPIMVCIWYRTNNFDDNSIRDIRVSRETLMGKILLFKI